MVKRDHARMAFSNPGFNSRWLQIFNGGVMQKSTNMEKQVCWGWDGVYDYPDMRQYYKQVVKKQIKEEANEEVGEEGRRFYDDRF